MCNHPQIADESAAQPDSKETSWPEPLRPDEISELIDANRRWGNSEAALDNIRLLGEPAELLANRFHPLFEVRNFAHEAASFGAACPAFVAPMP